MLSDILKSNMFSNQQPYIPMEYESFYVLHLHNGCVSGGVICTSKNLSTTFPAETEKPK